MMSSAGSRRNTTHGIVDPTRDRANLLLEWVIDQYQVSEDKQSGMTSDPNRPDHEEYILRLVGQVVRVSVETVKIVSELSGTVSLIPSATPARPSEPSQ